MENLPHTIKKIVIEDEKYMKYLTKIPFSCEIEIKNFNKDLYEDFILNDMDEIYKNIFTCPLV